MKIIYRVLAIELAMISVLCLFKGLELFAIPCLILYVICLDRSEKYE